MDAKLAAKLRKDIMFILHELDDPQEATSLLITILAEIYAIYPAEEDETSLRSIVEGLKVAIPAFRKEQKAQEMH
jgi:hypothetical protein